MARRAKGSNRNNKKAEYDGHKFDSKMELDYYLYLKDKERQGLLRVTALQPKFILQPSFKHKGKTVLAIAYVADFEVTTSAGEVYYVDLKGHSDAQFKIKRKLFQYVHSDKTLILVTQRQVQHGRNTKNPLDDLYWIDWDEQEGFKKQKNKSAKSS